MRIELCKGDTMTAKEYEKVLKDREKAWTNEEFKPHKLTEEEIEKRVKETFETIFYGSEEERFYHE